MLTLAHILTTGKPLAACAGACAAVRGMAMQRGPRLVGNPPRLVFFAIDTANKPENLMTRMFVKGAPETA